MVEELVTQLTDTINIEEALIRTGVQLSRTVFTANVVNGELTVEELSNAVGLQIALTVKQIVLAIDLIQAAGGKFRRSIAVITGAVPVTDTGSIRHPSTLSNATLLKVKGNTSVCDLIAIQAGKGLGIKVIPVFVNTDPTAGQLAGGRIVSLTVNDVQTGACILVTTRANDLSVININREGMTGSGNGGAPVNDGVTALAEGAAGVTGLGAGGSLVGNSSGGMDVGGAVLNEVGLFHSRVGGIRLGIHVELLVGEGGGGAVHMGDETHVNVHLHILGEEVVGGPIGCGSKAGNLDVGIKVNDTNGELGQHSLTGLDIVTGAGDGDGCGVGFCVDGILSREAISQIHMIELPVVDAVEVNDCLYRVNGFNVGSLQIHPINGTEGDSVKGGICGNKAQRGLCLAGLDLYDTDDNRLVAHLVADLELDAVVAVGYNVTVGDHLAAVEGAVYLNAVDVNLGGGGIQTGNVVQGLLNTHSVSQGGLICHGGRQVQDVGGSGDHVALDQRSGAIQIDLIDDGILSVIHSVGVIHGEAVHVVGVGTVDGTVGLPQEVILGSVGDDGDKELALLGGLTGGLTVSILHVELVGILQSHLFEGGDVHGHIMPAGLVNVVVDVLGLHHADGSQRVIGTVTVGVGHVVTLHPALDVVLGNIEPETDSAGVLQLNGLAVHAQTDPGVFTGVGLLGGKTVDLQTHGVITVMNLTVLAVCQRELQVVVTVVVGTAVDDVPHIQISLAALEVPQDLGALAQIQLNGGGGIGTHIQGSSHGAGQINGRVLLIHGDKVQAVEGAESIVGGGEGHVARAQTDLLSHAVHKGGCLHGDLSGLAEWDGDNGLLEEQGIGGNDGHGLLAHDLTLVDHLSGHGTLGAVGGEHTVCDGAHALFLDLPSDISGDIYLGTNSVRTKRVEGNGSTGGIIIIVGGQVCTGKLTVCGSGGNDQNGIGGRTLTAVGQGAVDLQVLTGTLRAEGGGSAAITVSSIDTAHLDHVVCHLVHGEAGRIRSLLTVGNSHNEGTVSSDTNKGSGGDAASMIFSRILAYRITVCVRLDQEGPDANSVLLPTGKRVGLGTHHNLRHIGGTGLTGQGMIVVVDYQNRVAFIEGCRATAVLVVITVQNVVIQGLTDEVRVLLVVVLGIPAKHSIGSHNNVTVAQLLGFQSLSGGGLSTVVAGSGDHSLVTGNNLDIGVVEVHNSSVHNLSSGAAIVVQNLLVLRHAGGDVPASFGNEVVCATSSVAVVVRALGCKSVRGDHADEHNTYKQQRQNFG